MLPQNKSAQKANPEIANTRQETGLTRRGFLQAAGMATFLVGMGGVSALNRQPGQFLRPPGALPDAQFAALCVKCDRCQQVCPTRIISPVTLTQSLAGTGTPQLTFRQGYCTLCNRCIDVCPTGALLPVAKEQVRIGIARIVQDKCIAWNWVACTKCEKECPTKAITLDDQKRPVVDEALCNGCGLCENVCISSIARTYGANSGRGVVVVPYGA